MIRKHRRSWRHRNLLQDPDYNLNMLSTKHYMKNTQNKWWASLPTDCHYDPLLTNMTHSLLQRQLGTTMPHCISRLHTEHKEADLDKWDTYGIYQDHLGPIRLTNCPEHQQRKTRILLLSSLSAKANLEIFRSNRELSESTRECPKHPACTHKTWRCLDNKMLSK